MRIDAMTLPALLLAALAVASLLAFAVPTPVRPLILAWHGNGQRCAACH